MILLEGWVFEHGLEEQTADGQGRAAALAQGSGAEVDTAILATYPGTDDQLRTYADKPGIGVVVRGSCLAAKLGVADIANVSPEGLGGAAGFAHAALEELLHEESALGGNNLLAAFTAVIDFLAVLVYHAGNEDGAVVLAIVGYRTVGVDQFQQLDVA